MRRRASCWPPGNGCSGGFASARRPTWRTRAATLAGSAANILAVEGGWYIAARLPRIRSEEEWAVDLLELENVRTQPGFFYDFESEAYLILSLLTEPAAFQEGIARLRGFVG